MLRILHFVVVNWLWRRASSTYTRLYGGWGGAELQLFQSAVVGLNQLEFWRIWSSASLVVGLPGLVWMLRCLL